MLALVGSLSSAPSRWPSGSWRPRRRRDDSRADYQAPSSTRATASTSRTGESRGRSRRRSSSSGWTRRPWSSAIRRSDLDDEASGGLRRREREARRTLRAFSDVLAGSAAQFQDPTFAGTPSPASRASASREWDEVNTVLAELAEQGIEVEQLARHGGVPANRRRAARLTLGAADRPARLRARPRGFARRSPSPRRPARPRHSPMRRSRATPGFLSECARPRRTRRRRGCYVAGSSRRSRASGNPPGGPGSTGRCTRPAASSRRPATADARGRPHVGGAPRGHARDLYRYVPARTTPAAPPVSAWGWHVPRAGAGRRAARAGIATCSKHPTRFREYTCTHGLGSCVHARVPQPAAGRGDTHATSSVRPSPPDCAQGAFHDYWISLGGGDGTSAPENADTARVGLRRVHVQATVLVPLLLGAGGRRHGLRAEDLLAPLRGRRGDAARRVYRVARRCSSRASATPSTTHGSAASSRDPTPTTACEE